MQLALWDLALLDTAAGLHRPTDTGTGRAEASPADSADRFGGTERMVVVTGKRGLSPIYLDRATAEALPDIRQRRGGSKRLVFGWYGGKFSHLDWLLPLLPKAHHYCEPFAGSAAVLINREPAPVETYNDIDGDVVNFFKVLREDPATLGRWANCKNTSRAGMSGVISRWFGGIDALRDIGPRLLRVQIENRPAIDVIRLYDSPDTLFYCDPPYLHETRGDSKAYGFEMDEEEHRNLATALNRITGKAAVSGYRCDLMDKLYKGWRRFDADEKHCHSIKQLRQECVWMNY